MLDKIDKGIFGVIGVSPKDEMFVRPPFINEFRDTFKKNIPFFKKSIRYLSEPLINAIESSRDKLLKTEMILEIGSCSGVFLFKDIQLAYNISSVSGSDDWSFCFYMFQGDKFIAFAAEDYINGSKQKLGWASSLFVPENIELSNEDRRTLGLKQFQHLILIINFLKYADVETKILPPNRQLWDGTTCIYNNKAKHNIEIIDSTWFTTLIKSDAFKVRGHFRLQPYGEGLSKRKLVWISDFEKHGYTRKAKLSDDKTTE